MCWCPPFIVNSRYAAEEEPQGSLIMTPRAFLSRFYALGKNKARWVPIACRTQHFSMCLCQSSQLLPITIPVPVNLQVCLYRSSEVQIAVQGALPLILRDHFGNATDVLNFTAYLNTRRAVDIVLTRSTMI
jgi:hypothetical protein